MGRDEKSACNSKFKQGNSLMELCSSMSREDGFCSAFKLHFSSSRLLFLSPIHLTPTTNSTNTPRRRHAHNHKPHPLAHNRRRHRPPTRLVPRPRNRILLHEHGLRHQRPRQRPTKHVLPHGTRLPNRRSIEEPVSRHILPTSSTVTERDTEAECGG